MSDQPPAIGIEGAEPALRLDAAGADGGTWLVARLGGAPASRVAGIRPLELARWLALSRDNLYWMSPKFGRAPGDVPAETQFLLWERDDGRYGLLLPLIDGDLRATVEGDAPTDSLALAWSGALPGAAPDEATLAWAGTGDEPYALIRAAMCAAAERLHTFRLREDKPTPAFCQYLGWCTWDAFYKEVDRDKVLAGLRSFKDGGVVPGFMILDDGWQDTGPGDTLNGFGADPAKFPGGLAALSREARELGVRVFGVWHALQGYWCGVNPAGPLARDYRTVPNRGLTRPWDPNDQPRDLHLLHPHDVHRFYDDFHTRLRADGVDLVKVDNHGALEAFSAGNFGRVSTMRAYQHALQGAATTHFLGNVIHCMSNGSDVAMNLLATSAWRNSDDYFPKRGPEAQQKHVHTNAMNAAWTQTFALPDWDMFQTHGPAPEFHAAARAISGGPVYVCDKPGEQDFGLLKKLVLSDGRVPSFDRPALPAQDCLMTDCLREPKLLKVTNVRGRRNAVVGLFNCQVGGGRIETKVVADDVPEWCPRPPDWPVVLYSNRTGELRLYAMEITLEPATWDVVTLAIPMPLRNAGAAVAVLGLLDKLAGAAAIERAEAIDGRVFEAQLSDGGTVGFYCVPAPETVHVVGRRTAPHRYDAGTRLLTVEASAGGPVRVRLTFPKG